MDIKTRVLNYYKNNQFIQKYIKGIDQTANEVVLEYNGQKKSVSVDLLEAISSEMDLISLFNPTPAVEAAPVVTPVAPEVQPAPASTPQVNASIPVVNAEIVPESKEQVLLTEKEELNKETLNDIKILNELKNKEGLNNLIKKFAVNPSTGLIDINEAIKKVTRNTMDEVEKSIRNGYEFDTDLTKYDIDGKYNGTPVSGMSSEDEKIARAFNNIKLFIDASKMYSDQVNYTESQVSTFMKTFIDKVKEELHGSVSVPVNTPVEPTTPQKPNVFKDESTGGVSSSAGFADIFVLTVIVLVYAVIIINLVMKLK